MKDLSALPEGLPVPVDDGACDHLAGIRMPSISLASTNGTQTNLSSLPSVSVVYFFPMIGDPNGPPMVGWNDIPGARGCTPQSCAFRDSASAFSATNTSIFGVSSQSPPELSEAKTRLQLPYELLSDANFELANALQLPTFKYKSLTLIKRVTLIIESGKVVKHFYPVFPPDKNAADALAWVKAYSNQKIAATASD